MGGIKTEDKIQIEHAARGCVSGSLAEWPYLDAALRRLDINLPLATNATALKFVCRGLVEAGAERERRERAEARVEELGGMLSEYAAASMNAEEWAALWKRAAKAYRWRAWYATSTRDELASENDALCMHKAALSREKEEARARIATLEAEAVALREALSATVTTSIRMSLPSHLLDKCRAALASSAGAGVIERLRTADAATEALKRAVTEMQAQRDDVLVRGGKELRDARSELEAGRALAEAVRTPILEVEYYSDNGDACLCRACLLTWRVDKPERHRHDCAVRAYEAARAKRGGA